MTRWERYVIRQDELSRRKEDLAGWVAGRGVLVGPASRVEQYLRGRIKKLTTERRAFMQMEPWRRNVVRRRWKEEQWLNE